jgi:glycosyltransferase involved in cell wall biosynthesis
LSGLNNLELETPKISVILPVYNEENYIRECIDSILSQTFSDFELICVDDGSTDASLDILSEYKDKDGRIKIILQQNQYAGVARNNGMSVARGDYLLFLDSDDFFEPDMFKKIYQTAVEYNLDITMCHYGVYDEELQCRQEVGLVGNNFWKKSEGHADACDVIMNHAIFQAAIGWAWDKLFRREYVEKCGYKFSNFRNSEDGFFVYMLMACTDKIGRIQERLVWHRMNNANSVSHSHEKQWEAAFMMLEAIYRELKAKNIYETYEKSFLSVALGHQIYYLETMQTQEVFDKCFGYIKNVTDPLFSPLKYKGCLYCADTQIDKYKSIIMGTSEEYLMGWISELKVQCRNEKYKDWIFPYDKVEKNSKVIIYGAGTVGLSFWKQLRRTEYCSELYIVDKKATSPAMGIRRIAEITFDYIIIAILDGHVRVSVKKWLMDDMQVDEDKIITLI